jgi:hypothetical protein
MGNRAQVYLEVERKVVHSKMRGEGRSRLASVEDSLRRAAKIDANHNEIADYLRGVGWSVFSTATIGRGFPDLLVGRPGFAALVEVKSDKRISHRRDRELTPDEAKWAEEWTGPYVIVTNSEDAAEQLLALWRGWK